MRGAAANPALNNHLYVFPQHLSIAIQTRLAQSSRLPAAFAGRADIVVRANAALYQALENSNNWLLAWR